MTNQAAIYCRISQDTEGQQLGVARQQQDCEALAARLGLTVTDVYIDDDIGASTRSRKKHRPEYERMLSDARADRFSTILAYSNSRLTRRPVELEALIQLHERTGVMIRTCVSGQADLATADGRQYARIQASIDAGEVERTAERVARKHLEKAQSGAPVGGTRPFGWAEDKRTLHPVESEMVRDAAADILRGVTAVAIAKRWNAAHVTTTRGHGWSGEAVKQVLRSPRIAGWRVYRGDIAADRAGEPVRGLYEPILDDATWRAVVARLRPREERRSRVPRKGSRHYLLTGLLLCGECGAPMYGNRVTLRNKDGEYTTHVYHCDAKRTGTGRPHGNAISGEPLDALVAEWVLSAAELVRETDAGSPDEDRQRLQELRAEISGVTEMIEDVMAAFRNRDLSAGTAFKSVGQLEERRTALEAERDALEAEVRAVRPTALDRERWDAMKDVDERRIVVETWLSAVYVRRAEKRTNRMDPSRVEPVWR